MLPQRVTEWLSDPTFPGDYQRLAFRFLPPGFTFPVIFTTPGVLSGSASSEFFTYLVEPWAPCPAFYGSDVPPSELGGSDMTAMPVTPTGTIISLSLPKLPIAVSVSRNSCPWVSPGPSPTLTYYHSSIRTTECKFRVNLVEEILSPGRASSRGPLHRFVSGPWTAASSRSGRDRRVRTSSVKAVPPDGTGTR